MKTLQQFIETFYNGFVKDTRTNGEQFVKLSDTLENRDIYQDIIREVHEGALPCDVIYSTIESVLSCMCDCLNDNEDLDTLEEYTDNLEVDNFMSLNFKDHYLDTALQEIEPKSFSALTGYAEYLFSNEVKGLLLAEIKSLEGEEWDHED